MLTIFYTFMNTVYSLRYCIYRTRNFESLEQSVNSVGLKVDGTGMNRFCVYEEHPDISFVDLVLNMS